MTEYERKREEIGGIILKAMYYGLERSQHWWANQEHDELPLFADQILSLVEIRADDQNEGLPLEPLNPIASRTWKVTVSAMLNPDKKGCHWIRVIPQPKTEEKV